MTEEDLEFDAFIEKRLTGRKVSEIVAELPTFVEDRHLQMGRYKTIRVKIEFFNPKFAISNPPGIGW